MMEFRLKENDWKSHWSTATNQYLNMKIEEKSRLVRETKGLEMIRHAVDLANYCMMKADNALPDDGEGISLLEQVLISHDKPPVGK